MPLQAHLMPKSIAGLLEQSCKEYKDPDGEMTDKRVLREKRETLHKMMELAYDGMFAEPYIKLLFTNEDIQKYKLTNEE